MSWTFLNASTFSSTYLQTRYRFIKRRGYFLCKN
ncbi:hypothetical protein FOC4_g10014935 [Fusarium odoratissimum]|uniref:Uncharacterized protein n=1 Tax=Fusarium oxysporum f. sp. cubense (strain race 4) TaxID=2502994 RepID=N1R7E4_FUSC4|nr:hypothetical protein FOC4_g10014935 [Fusarium odoratissimum]